MLRIHRLSLALLALVTALSFTVVSADARPSSSSGSRGSRTFSAPAATRPRQARRADRAHHDAADHRPTATAAQPGGGRPGCSAGRPVRRRIARRPRRGLHRRRPVRDAVRSRLGGRHGRLRLDVRPAVADRARRDRRAADLGLVAAAQPAGLCRRALVAAGSRQRGNRLALVALAASAVFGGGASAGRRPATAARAEPEDFDAFEKLLGEIQTAYGKEDLAALRDHVTPEMLSYYLRRAGAEREQRRHQPDLRRQAAAGRPVGSLARRATTNTPPWRCAIRSTTRWSRATTAG